MRTADCLGRVASRAIRAFKSAHAQSKCSVDNRGKIDSSETTIFTSRVAALLYLHLCATHAFSINGNYAGKDYIALSSRRIPQSRPDAIVHDTRTDLRSDIVEATLIYSAPIYYVKGKRDSKREKDVYDVLGIISAFHKRGKYLFLLARAKFLTSSYISCVIKAKTFRSDHQRSFVYHSFIIHSRLYYSLSHARAYIFLIF